jgi:hypothetical protein
MIKEGTNFWDFVKRLIRKLAMGNEKRYPPDGPSNTPKPLLNPLKTGSPIIPKRRYNTTAIKASRGDNKSPHIMMMRVWRVILISPMGIGGINTVPMDKILVKRAIFDILRSFISFLSRKRCI